jgi:hypothetical protein
MEKFLLILALLGSAHLGLRSIADGAKHLFGIGHPKPDRQPDIEPTSGRHGNGDSRSTGEGLDTVRRPHFPSARHFAASIESGALPSHRCQRTWRSDTNRRAVAS